MLENYVSTDDARTYRLTEHELRTHLVNSGDPFPDNTIEFAKDNRTKCRDSSTVTCHNMNTSYGTIISDLDGFFWLKTRTLRIPGW